MIQIRQKIKRLSGIIRKNNQQGFHDSARWFESLSAQLLNITYGWNLKNQNDQKPNKKMIDLTDETQTPRIHVQVTTQGSHIRGKLISTFNAFYSDASLFKDELYFFSLFGYETLPCDPIPSFRCLSMDSLLHDLTHAPADRQRKALAVLQQFEDKQQITNIHSSDCEQMHIPMTVIDDKPFSVFSYGMGRVRLNAFIPNTAGERLSCLIVFAKHSASDVFITLDQEQILQTLFAGCKCSNLNKRGFIAALSEKEDVALI